MKYNYITIVLSVCLCTASVASDDTFNSATTKDEIGFGLGALIGGLIAGPPGIIIGAAGGAWLGNKEGKEDAKITNLEDRLIKKQTELASLQNEFSDLQSTFGNELKKVKFEKRYSALEDLSRGVSLTIYFRTESANIDSEIVPRIGHLATYLEQFPEIQLHLEAHADRRGHEKYNRQLSYNRAQSVETELIRAGINNKRIHIHSYGESNALAVEGDTEGYVFDRRVNIILTLDTEV